MEKDVNKQVVEGVNGIPPKTAALLTFHERFDFLIRRFFLSQQEVADRLGVGQPHISGLRHGRTNPSKKIISRIVSEFNCNAEWLNLGSGQAFPPPEETLPKELKPMFDLFIEEYNRLDSDKDKFELQNEMYNFLKAFSQRHGDSK